MPALLLVDGDPNFRRALAVALRLEGLDVVESADVDAARSLLTSAGASAALVDLLLPGSHDLVAALGRAGLRILVTSPHAESFGAVPAHHVRLLKPFAAGELLAALGKSSA